MQDCFVSVASRCNGIGEYKDYQKIVKKGNLTVNPGTARSSERCDLTCFADSSHLGASLGWCGAVAESFALALDAAVAHLHDACGGYWPGVSPDYIPGEPSMR